MNRDLYPSIFSAVSTPSYTFDLDVFHRRVSLVKDAFGEKTHICYSIKANPFLLKYLPPDFEYLEVCSPGELTICEKAGVDMQKVIFSGVNKTREDIERAMDDNVGIFTVESFLHLKLINEAALRRNKVVPVLLRLTGGSQFGMEENCILQIIHDRDAYKGIDVIGLHFFTGTQKRKMNIIEKELDYLLTFIAQIHAAEQGFFVKRLEYGTGLAVDYFDENAALLEEERLNSIAPKIREISESVELTIEMGRFFTADCGYYFTTVVDTKTNNGVNYAILDGGLNQLKYDGQLQGMQIPVIHHIRSSSSVAEHDTEKWTLCGSLCTTADVLARNVEFCQLQIGDHLVFTRTGAYSAMEGMTVFLSREMPVIAIYSQRGGLEILREKINTDFFNTP